LNGGFGVALALSSASGMTKPEGNRCDVQGWRDAWSESRGMYRSVAVGLHCLSGKKKKINSIKAVSQHAQPVLFLPTTFHGYREGD